MFVTTLGMDNFDCTWYHAAVKKAPEELCVEQNRELFSDIRGRGGASNACFHS